MSRFFIDRPIFAWVIAILLMLAGALSITRLPVERYPTVAPPSISVNAIYPGASAKVVEDSVTQIIEQQMTGLDGLIYMSSNSASSGMASITLTFETGTDADVAQVQVQNKLQSAMPLLPQEVQRQGVRVNKGSSSFLQVLAFISTDGSMTRDDLSDYVSSTIVDPLSRVPGVGSVQVFGGAYAMRIWLDPDKLDTFDLAVSDVIGALQAQNAQVALGQLGGTPAVPGQELNATISAQDRLQTPEQFRAIVVRANNDGSLLRLGDIARVEIGPQSYDAVSRYNRQPATGVAVSLATGANALDTADAVAALMEQLKPNLPAGMEIRVPFDTTPFVRVSIESVMHTLVEAVVLVFLVMFLFLQNIRATIIPTIAVPVVLLGTVAMLGVMGFSINMLTMFAMVLAIGLLVDDAIVVVENVERVMAEEGLSPVEATRKSMDQISGALVGIGVVLAAVFVPMGFMGGATGIIYKQFTGTIVIAMALSVFIALVLTPALCATLLKPMKKGEEHSHMGGPVGKFFDWFNRKFDAGSARYQRGVSGILGRPKRFMLIYAVLVAVMAVLFMRLPTSFLPDEDQGVLMAMVQAPTGATQERTLKSIYKLEDYFLEKETSDVESVFSVQGFSFAGSGQNTGMAFVKLKDWDERTTPQSQVSAIVGRAMGALSQIQDAMVYAFAPPPMPELGISTGFTFFLQDNTGKGHEALLAARNQLLGAAAQSKLLAQVRPNGQDDTPQLRVVVDPVKAQTLGVPVATINNTLAVAWGGAYVDDFIDRGRVKRVYMQADAPYRMTPKDFERWSVRGAGGQMVPVSSFASWHWEYGSPRLERYNGVAAVEIQGQGAEGVSSGDAMAEIERLVSELPPGYTAAWTAMSYQERQAGNQSTMLYILSLLIVFLALAALYESWSVPTAVLMVAPLGVLGAVLAAMMRGYELDVYFQVGMLTTVGLTSKNAVLIIEFAKQNYEQYGMKLIPAIMQAVRDRLRPIIMTSLAFGLGVLPLAIATGAGSGAQNVIGTSVLGGMIVGTALGVFFIPLFYLVVVTLFTRKKKAPAPKDEAAPAGGDPTHG